MSDASALPPLASADDDPHGVHLRLSAQRALWGTAGPHVEQIYVAYEGMRVRFVAIVDEGLPDDEREALSGAAAEIIADYPAGLGLFEEVVVGPRNGDGWLVYQRYQAHIYREQPGAPQAGDIRGHFWDGPSATLGSEHRRHLRPRRLTTRLTFRVANPGDAVVLVRLEPWGREYDLNPRATRQFVFDGPDPAELEVEVGSDDFTIYGWAASVVDD